MVVDFVIEILFPRFCAGCGQEGTVWCRGCEQAVALPVPEPACPFCRARGSDRTCANCHEDTFLDGLTALSSYAHPSVREILTTWKYHGDPACAQTLERWVRQAAARLHTPSWTQAVCHVPLHPWRERERGFDQGRAIAEIFSRARGLPRVDLLSRARRTASQARVASGTRLVGDMDGVFAAAGSVPYNVVLCDDVFTSGATMDAAAKCLKEAGAKEVWGFVIAKARG